MCVGGLLQWEWIIKAWERDAENVSSNYLTVCQKRDWFEQVNDDGAYVKQCKFRLWYHKGMKEKFPDSETYNADKWTCACTFSPLAMWIVLTIKDQEKVL